MCNPSEKGTVFVHLNFSLVTFSFPICVEEQPDAPNIPKIGATTANSMLVSWNEPKDNGSPVLGYWLERKEINSTHWTRVNRNLLSALEMRVEGLMEGLTYIFRVCAENLAGPGNFSVPSEPKTAQDPICKLMRLTTCSEFTTIK